MEYNNNTYAGSLLNSGRQDEVYTPYDPYAGTGNIKRGSGSNAYRVDYSQGTTYGDAGAPSLGSPASTGVGLLSMLASAANPISLGVGAVTSIIDTISGIFGQNDYKKQMEENRKMAMQQYREQRAIDAEEKQYSRGIAERNFNYAVKENEYSKALAKKQDAYSKYVNFIGGFTNQINANKVNRQNMITNYRNAPTV